MTGNSMTAYQEGYTAGERQGRLAARDAAIEECAQAVEKGVLPWDDSEFAKACRHNAQEIRALSAVTSTERGRCPVCMGSGYSNHPDSGEVCQACKGQGQGLAALHNDKE